jgi:hypothetical protein
MFCRTLLVLLTKVGPGCCEGEDTAQLCFFFPSSSFRRDVFLLHLVNSFEAIKTNAILVVVHSLSTRGSRLENRNAHRRFPFTIFHPMTTADITMAFRIMTAMNSNGPEALTWNVTVFSTMFPVWSIARIVRT